MAHHCKDCSYTRDGVFPDGKCPACGSYHISGKAPLREGDKSQTSGAKNLRLAMGLGLWVYLFYLLYDKLLA